MKNRRKPIFIVLFVIFGCFYSFAQTPPGTKKIKIADSTYYIDKRCLTVIDWLEFLYSIRMDSTLSDEYYQEMMIDTTVWNYWHGRLDENEFSYPAMRNTTLVGIDPHKAQAYCEWRTRCVNIYYAYHHKTTRVKYELLSPIDYKSLCDSHVFDNLNKNYPHYDYSYGELTDDSQLFLYVNKFVSYNDNLQYRESITFRCKAIIIQK